MHHYSQGESLRQAHKGIPEGCFEEEQGRKGFFGPVSHITRKKPSTRWRKIEGPLKPRLFDLVELEKTDFLQRLLYNNDLVLYNLWLKAEAKTWAKARRNADGDVIYFCHKGRGRVWSEYGQLEYSAGCYVNIPKCITHVFVPSEESNFFVIESRTGAFEEPARGIAGKNALYDMNALGKPDLAAQQKAMAETKAAVKLVEVKHSDEMTYFEYDECVFSDIIGWKGDFFPFTLHMDHIMPIMSHRSHLPPSAHSTFVAKGFVVCSFLPRPLESDADALRVPFYHQNIDYDEVLFYHDGNFFSRDGLHAGMISFHPAGFPHGPHPKAVKAIEGKTHTNEYAVMVDSWNKLHRDPILDRVENKDYWKSWQT